ncbi:acyl-CoA thioesterase/bile acid-CoA:amino acid N-acyltransferase family protein [uncultured Pseudomonas sp.]|uniref:acyl-CoA thioesterase/bile acid-CoA:amino acid N-acyltransferase family protein n=1 Tax=uncultured Pseudomonas sp. TaxID=114707 RepID=UPI0025FD64EE|nr:acyl-CoA thioesterase/bile acid-CoA:amino acid N-acyltransferase family protein [uncultured Pseudomonas sp.]
MIELSVSPASGLLDEPRHVRVVGLAPGQRITLTARTRRGHGVGWISRAQFVADAQGRVDLQRDAPVAGDYQGVSALGLLWSQKPEGQPASAAVFPDDLLQPLQTHITLDGSEVAATLTQYLAGAGVSRHEVREDGLVGTLFLPAGPGPHPAVMVLNGSGGGINEPRAALYASRGYAALALGYFKAPGLSDYISNTPLEYFERGLDWLRREVRPAHDFVALSGQSRGGELVLLLASLFPEKVSAVIGYVPSALVHGGQAAADPVVGRDGPAWLYRGQPLVHLWNDNRTASWQARDAGQRNALSMLSALDDPEAVARARIAVEKIQGPVLLLSAGDDAAWPSDLFSRMVSERLAQFEHPWPVQHLDFPQAGHSILLPFIPSTYSQDGTPAANAEANQGSWQGVRQFLQDAVAARQASLETHP